jgi:carboxypeptidase family protein
MGRHVSRFVASGMLWAGLVTVPRAGAIAQGTAGTATLIGTIRDSTGAPIASAEIVLREKGQILKSVRTNDRGEFGIADVAPGAYTVWFRRLGFHSVDYNWAARFGARDSVKVTLSAVARSLNPVVIREREDNLMKGSSSLLGLVVDTDGNAISEASVELVGADRGGMTRENGGFLFRPLPLGPYVLRVRKLGYAPAMVSMNLQSSDEREIIVKLRRLSTTLDAVTTLAQSGYSHADQQALEALDRRLRWRGVRNYVLGPDDLRRYEGLPMDYAVKALGVQGIEAMKGGGSKPSDDVCVLVNGRTFERRPLSSYNINDFELLEIYPSKSEDTRTVRDKMLRPCEEQPNGKHLTWYVLWMKGYK